MDHSMPGHDMPGHDMPNMPDHSGHNMGHTCSMNMLFTWSTQDLCIVFPSWHISSTWSLILSLLAIVIMTAGYEAVREGSRRYEATGNILGNGSGLQLRGDRERLSGAAGRLSSSNLHTDDDDEHPDSPLLWPGKRDRQVQSSQRSRTVKGLLYAVQVFYSFFIMLLFMTYNGWVMLAVAVGAFVGYMVFGADSSSSKTVACH